MTDNVNKEKQTLSLPKNTETEGKQNGLSGFYAQFLEVNQTEEKEKRISAAFEDIASITTAQPLSIGSGKEIIKQLRAKGHSLNPSKAAINRYVNSKNYHYSVINSEFRLNIDGSQAEKVTEADKLHARKMINRIKKQKAKKEVTIKQK